ncbi:vesicular glutamate transporter 1-like [Babylonia areolata]|uniref:vesicular glutamate transporter 1-like n=1 Tax=Babylonia areolata TaxID=304850 RepID=UPI003FD22187
MTGVNDWCQRLVWMTGVNDWCQRLVWMTGVNDWCQRLVWMTAVWGLVVAQFCAMWGMSTAMLLLPSFFASVLHLPIERNGMLSAVPLLCVWVTGMVCNVLADHLQSRRYLSTRNTRKAFHTAGSLMLAVLPLVASYSERWPVVAVVLMTTGLAGAGVCAVCFRINSLDIAPAYAGILLGLTCTVGALSGCLAPALLGVLINRDPTVGGWRAFFFISAALYLGGIAVYGMWGKGEEMEWARVPSEEDEDDNNHNDTKTVTTPFLLEK